MGVVAVMNHPQNGYDHDKNKIAELGIQLGEKFETSEISVGRSSSSFKLKAFPNVWFNTVNFDFEDQFGNPINIYIRYQNYGDGSW